jgi:hypothetical protein
MDPRKPVIPIDVQEDEGYVTLTYDGEVRSAARITLAPDDVGRMKAGYVCAKCWEPHAVAFPKQCSVCRFPMAERQSEFLAKAYQGNVRLGPTVSMEDELAAIEDLQQRKEREATVSAPQIIVPRGWQ